jgi:hypothetical protein
LNKNDVALGIQNGVEANFGDRQQERNVLWGHDHDDGVECDGDKERGFWGLMLLKNGMIAVLRYLTLAQQRQTIHALH